jgi:hypothetical protein
VTHAAADPEFDPKQNTRSRYGEQERFENFSHEFVPDVTEN